MGSRSEYPDRLESQALSLCLHESFICVDAGICCLAAVSPGTHPDYGIGRGGEREKWWWWGVGWMGRIERVTVLAARTIC